MRITIEAEEMLDGKEIIDFFVKKIREVDMTGSFGKLSIVGKIFALRFSGDFTLEHIPPIFHFHKDKRATPRTIKFELTPVIEVKDDIKTD